MALTNDEKRMARSQVAAYLADMKAVGFVLDAKPEVKEYYGFIALRLAKKLRLDTDTTKGDPIPTKAEPQADKPKVLNAKAEAKAVPQNKTADNAVPKAKTAPKAKATRKPAVRTKEPLSQTA